MSSFQYEHSIYSICISEARFYITIIVVPAVIHFRNTKCDCVLLLIGNSFCRRTCNNYFNKNYWFLHLNIVDKTISKIIVKNIIFYDMQ